MKKFNFQTIALLGTICLGVITYFASKPNTPIHDQILESVEVLTNEENTSSYGCGGNVTFIKDETLRPHQCWNGGTHLVCEEEDGVCCNPSGQTDCGSVVK